MEHRDRNLLFGVLAVQAGMITPAQLAEAGALWATDPAKDLALRLAERGQLRAGDRELVERLVDRAIEAHGGDPGATLSSFGGDASVIHSFAGSIVRSESGGVHTILSPGEVSGALGDGSVPGLIETAGRYSTHSEYARGGMGRVLLVHDEHLGRDIALKELLPELSGKSGSEPGTPVRQSMPFLKRFLQEARITGQLEHPSIVPVYELGRRLDGSVYYTMKLVRGKTLGHAIAGARNIEERLRLLPHFVDLCQAIAYAHNRRVIHRDIKPGNVMVGEFGETVVLDWGLAKVVGKEDAHATGLAETLHALRLGDEKALGATQYGEALGTPMYMPPEQAKGHLEQIDERSDVYSLGAVLFEMLAGVPPFDGKTLHHILRQVIEEAPQSIATLEPKAPPELVAIAMRALAKDPSKRYQSAKELAEEVQRFQSGALVGAYTYSLRHLLKRYAAKHKSPILTAAVAAALLLGLAGYSYWWISDERNTAIIARDQAQASRDLASKQKDLALNAIQQLTYGVPDRLAHIPKSRPILSGILDENIQLLDQILALEPNTTTAKYFKADSYRRIAGSWVLMGDTEKALRAAQAALGITQSLVADNPNGIVEKNGLALAYTTLAWIQDCRGEDDSTAAKNALALYETLSASDPTTSHLHGLAGAYHRMGVILARQGELEAARASYEKSLSLHSRLSEGDPDDDRIQRDMARTYVGLGMTYERKEDHEAALNPYKQGLALYERLSAEDPDDVALRTDLASTYLNIGVTHRAQGDQSAALKSFERGLVLYERLSLEDPDNASLQISVATTYLEIGRVHERRKEYADALNSFALSAAPLRTLTQRDPSNADIERRLGSVLQSIGGTRIKTGASEQGTRDLEEAVAHHLRAVELAPSALRRLLWGELVGACTVLKSQYRMSGQTDSLLSLESRIVAAWRQFAAADSLDIEPRRILARAIFDLARTEESAGKPEEAIASLEEAITVWRELADLDPSDKSSTKEIARIRQRLDTLRLR